MCCCLGITPAGRHAKRERERAEELKRGKNTGVPGYMGDDGGLPLYLQVDVTSAEAHRDRGGSGGRKEE